MTTTETPVLNSANELTEKLKQQTAAVRFCFWKFGVSKSLTTDQKVKAAEAFHATGDALSAGKKLLNTRHPKYKAVTQAINRARGYWKLMSVWYPVKGIRLIRRDLIPQYEQQMATYLAELAEAVAELESAYSELRNAARDRLGELFNPHDYPDTIQDLFGFRWEYPSVEPPNYLKDLNPALYEAEKNRIAQRFQESLAHAEEAFTAELAGLVDHLLERLTGEEDGKPKVFRNSAIKNMTEFFDRFKTLSIGSNAELEALVEQAERALAGVDPSELRKDKSLRGHIAGDLAKVQEVLDGMLVDRPTRTIRLEEETE